VLSGNGSDVLSVFINAPIADAAVSAAKRFGPIPERPDCDRDGEIYNQSLGVDLFSVLSRDEHPLYV